MELLVITWNYPPRRGGMESLLGDLCQGLKKRHRVSVIAAYAGSADFPEDNVFRPRWPGLAAFSLFALYRGALLLHRNKEIHVVFGGSAMVTPLVLLLARLFQRKAALQVHGLDLIYRSRFYQFLCVRWLGHCDRIVANSRYTASLAETKGVGRHAIVVIPPGVHGERRLAGKSPDTIGRRFGMEGKKIILFVGRLARRKGVVEFIRNCVSEIVTEIPEACLVVVGQNPTQSLTHRDDVAGEIEAAVSALGLEKHVRLLGWLEDADLASIYRLCHLIVLPVIPVPDDIEGFGIVLLEAAAAGKPAVATRVGGIPDAVEDGKSGILVEPEDYGSMSRVILEILRDDALRQSIGRLAQQRVREQFAWPVVVPRYTRVLMDLRVK